jgi:hypothetical protein
MSNSRDEVNLALKLQAIRVADERMLADIEDKIRDEIDNDERKIVDENLKQFSERLKVMIANGFTEDQACKIVAQMMCENKGAK